jgi:3-hydroxyisobutyrate dehydrogenase
VGPVAFIGLGMMGRPMAARLVAAGFETRGADPMPEACQALADAGGQAFATAREAAEGASIVITMLPDGKVVRDALLGAGGAVEVLAPGALVVDMSSSAPLDTRGLAEDLAARGLTLIDAPVSGGVRRVLDGTLTIMVGGDATAIEKARPLLAAMGKAIIPTGPVGSGHAVKALNNYVSAAGLAAACEAALIAERFGVDPAVLVDVLNVSTGKNNSTEVKMKPFILSGTFASGFSMALMAKDLRTAADLARQLGIGEAGTYSVAELWMAASTALGKSADHTEIHRFLAGNDN